CAVRAAIEAVYPEAIAILIDANHEIHEVSRGLPAFPVFGPANPNSLVLLAVADMPSLPTGLAQRTVCRSCDTPPHVVVLALQLIETHEYLLGVAGDCIEVVPAVGQDRIRVHDVGSNWGGPSDESLAALRQLLAACRSAATTSPSLASFSFKGTGGDR